MGGGVILEIDRTFDKANSKSFDKPLYSVKIIHMTLVCPF